MAECPFCGGEVDEDLITFGGSCPKCFAHIPGEEAATDPGEEVKAKQDAQDRRRSAFRAMIPIMALVPVVMCAGIGAIYLAFLRPEPEVAVLDFDELDMYYTPEIVGDPTRAPGELPGQPTKIADANPSASGVIGSGSGSADPNRSRPDPTRPDPSRFAPPSGVGEGSSGADALKERPAGDGGDGPRIRDNVTGPAGPAGFVDPSSAKPGGAGDLDFGLDASQKRKGKALDDPDQIRTMIADKMSQQIQRLNICYEQQLKVEPSLQGKWRIKYTVNKDGTVTGAAAEGLTSGNSAFETCMADQMIRWRFDAIAYAQPVQRTIAFRPQ